MHCVILNVLDDLQSIVSLFDIWELLNGKGRRDGFRSQRRISGLDWNSSEVLTWAGQKDLILLITISQAKHQKKILITFVGKQNFHYNRSMKNILILNLTLYAHTIQGPKIHSYM